MSLKLKIPASSVRADFTPGSYNAADNTIEVVFATEFEAQRSTWDGTQFLEILDCTPSAVRLARLNSGANLVDTHNTSTVNAIYGVVTRAWIENNVCKASIRLSKRADAAGIVGDIIDGIITNISVRYTIYGATQIENENELIKVRITDWEPCELTICSVPVDYTSGVRSQETSNYYEINISTNRSMTPEEIAAAAAAEAERVRSLNPNPAPNPAPAPAPAPQPDLVALERARVQEITTCVRTAGIEDHAFLDNLVSSGVSADGARSAIFTHLQASQTQIRGQHSGLRINVEEIDKVRTAMSNALEHRVNPAVALIPGASDFRGMSLIDMGRDCIERSGGSAKGLSRRQIAEMALNSSRAVGMNSTSDFPIILGDTVNRVLRKEYDLQMPTFTGWASRGTAKDFRTMTRVSLGEVGDFKEVKEGGEYEYTTLGEAGESYKVIKYGQLIAITWETMINDDLDAFSRIPRKIASAAARKQSDLVYGILTGNPNMADGNPLFSSQHKNIATAAVIGIDNFGLMRKLMRTQKGIDSKDFLNLTPEYLITGPSNEQLALQYTSTNFTANVAGSQNVWAGLVKPIIEPRITDTSWFFAASPNAIDTIEYSFLEGEGELFTEQRQGFEVDGMEIKARMVFGAKAIDWRGLAKNAGV
jgi:hypothetical protein